MSRRKKSAGASVFIENPHEKALERYQPYLARTEFEELKKEIILPLEPTIRVNLLKHQPVQLIRTLTELYNWNLEPISFCPSGFRIRSDGMPPSQTIEHRMGDFYIQEAASMLPAQLFDLSKNEQPLILDMAASPGGKTIHLADLGQDRGFVLANDASRSRIPALQVVLRKWGTVNQAITCMPGEVLGQMYFEGFDFVLLDAPCSMEGLRSTASHGMRSISDKERERLAYRQQKLLESALYAVRVGGQVVYSTCTLAPEENESILAAILDRFPGAVQVDDLQNLLPLKAPALEQFNGIQYPESILNAFRIWPQIFHTAGFFAARMTKIADLPLTKGGVSATRGRKRNFHPIANKQAINLSNQLLDQYGFDLAPLKEQQELVLTQDQEKVCLIPTTTIDHFMDLPIISSGMILGEQIGDELIPSHEFAARFGAGFQTGKVTLEDEQVSKWQKGEDLREISTSDLPKGRVVVVNDRWGRNLGRGKVLTNQLKNLLPNRLF